MSLGKEDQHGYVLDGITPLAVDHGSDESDREASSQQMSELIE
jgi:hypothetical protein